MSEFEIILAFIIGAVTLFLVARRKRPEPPAVEPAPPEPYNDTYYETLRERITSEPDPVPLSDAGDAVLGKRPVPSDD